MKIAIVCDYLMQFGGVERVIKAIHRIFPEAPIYTVVFDPDALPEEFKDMDVRTSFVNRLPLSRKKFEWYIPLYGFAVEQLDLRDYDVVLSISTMVAKGVITKAKACHISMCFTPMRWAWDLYQNYIDEIKGRFFMRRGFRILTHYFRLWDVATASRVNYFIAGSKIASRRIQKHYGRESEVIYPPIETEKFKPTYSKPDDFYLVVSRLVYAKRIDVVVEAFTKLQRRLVVIGRGERFPRLKKMATNNIEFLGFQNDDILGEYYAKCKALIFPGEEDFGLATVEAQACGRPVIAYAAGGALETILNEKTGLFFYRQTPQAVIEAVKKFEFLEFDSRMIRENALRFGEKRFESALKSFVEEKYEEYIDNFYGTDMNPL